MKKHKFIITILFSFFVLSLFALAEQTFKQEVSAEKEDLRLNVIVNPMGAGKINLLKPLKEEHALGRIDAPFREGNKIEAEIDQDETFSGFKFDRWVIAPMEEGKDSQERDDKNIDFILEGDTNLFANFTLDQDYLNKLFPRYPERLEFISEEIYSLAEQMEDSIKKINTQAQKCACENMQSLCVPETGLLDSPALSETDPFGDPCPKEARRKISGQKSILESTSIRLSFFSSLLEEEKDLLQDGKEFETLPESHQEKINELIEKQKDAINKLKEDNKEALNTEIVLDCKSNCSQIPLGLSATACIGLSAGEQKPIELNWLVEFGLEDLDLGDFIITALDFTLPEEINIADFGVKDTDFNLTGQGLKINFPDIKLVDFDAEADFNAYQDGELNVSTTKEFIGSSEYNYGDDYEEPESSRREAKETKKVEEIIDYNVENTWHQDNFSWLSNRCIGELHEDFFITQDREEDVYQQEESCANLVDGVRDLGHSCQIYDKETEENEYNACTVRPCPKLSGEKEEKCEEIYEELIGQDITNISDMEDFCDEVYTKKMERDACKQGLQYFRNPSNYEKKCTDECEAKNASGGFILNEEERDDCYLLYPREDKNEGDVVAWKETADIEKCFEGKTVAEYTHSQCAKIWEESWKRYWPYERVVGRWNWRNTNLSGNEEYYNNIIKGEEYYNNITEGGAKDISRAERITKNLKEIGIPTVCLAKTPEKDQDYYNYGEEDYDPSRDKPESGIGRPELRKAMSLERECKELMGENHPDCQLEIDCTIPKKKYFWLDYFSKLSTYLGDDWSCVSENEHCSEYGGTRNNLFFDQAICYTSEQNFPTHKNVPCQDLFCDTDNNSNTFTNFCNNFWILHKDRDGWGWNWIWTKFDLHKDFLEDYYSKEMEEEGIDIEPFCEATEGSVKTIKETIWGSLMGTEEGKCEELKQEAKDLTSEEYQEKAFKNLKELIDDISGLGKADVSVCDSKYSDPKKAIKIKCKKLDEPPLVCRKNSWDNPEEDCEDLLSINLADDKFLTYGNPKKALNAICQENNLVDEPLCQTIALPEDSCHIFHLLTEGEYMEEEIERTRPEENITHQVSNPQITHSSFVNDDFHFKSAPKIEFDPITFPSIEGPRISFLPFLDIKLPGFIFEDFEIPDMELCNLDECRDFFPSLNFNIPGVKIPDYDLTSFNLGSLVFNAEIRPGKFEQIEVNLPKIDASIEMPNLIFEPKRLDNLLNYSIPNYDLNLDLMPEIKFNLNFEGIEVDWAAFVVSFIKSILGVESFNLCITSELMIYSLPIRIWFDDYVFSWPSFPEIPDLCKGPNEFCKTVKDKIQEEVGDLEESINEKISTYNNDLQEAVENLDFNISTEDAGFFDQVEEIIKAINKELKGKTLEEGDKIEINVEGTPITITIENGILKISPIVISLDNVLGDTENAIKDEIKEKIKGLETETISLEGLESFSFPSSENLYEQPLPTIPLNDLSYTKDFSYKIGGFQKVSLGFSTDYRMLGTFKPKPPKEDEPVEIHIGIESKKEVIKDIYNDLLELKTSEE